MNKNKKSNIDLKIGVAATLLVCASFANSATLTVGPNKMHPTPCSAFYAANDGDTIEIDAAGNYTGNVCAIGKNMLKIIGVNGRPKINANGQYALGKGTWVFSGTNNIVDNIEFSGARVPDKNGAGIRIEPGVNLTVKNSVFRDNENGILTSNNGGNLDVTNTEFAHNGYGDGYSHNIYVGNIDSLTFIGNYSHDANIGHNVKTRASKNIIKYNRISSSAPNTVGVGAPSYEIDVPNGGLTYIIGNIIQQPSSHNNPGLVTYGVEGLTKSSQELFVINNTFINEDSSRGTFVFIGGQIINPALIQNNLFIGTGNITTQGNATLRTNYSTLTPAVVNKSAYDLHLAPNSPMINGGTNVLFADGIASQEYEHVSKTILREKNGIIDIGAYEAGNTVFTPTPISTPNPTPAITWTQCATENAVCSFSGTRQIRYGAKTSYVYKTATGSINCNNSTFNDPIPGIVKTCSFVNDSATTIPIPTPTEPINTLWTKCANEGGFCNFSGTASIRYGANGKFAFKSATSTIACNNATFGDPAAGFVKTCDYQITAAPTPSWTKCANEGGVCSFIGTKEVRYGANGKFAFKSATSTIACNNTTFGDPAVGFVKACEVLK